MVSSDKTHRSLLDSELPQALGRIGRLARLAGTGVLETLYPTRCAVCDKPGVLLCFGCRQHLAHIDAWKACPRCGAAWGYLECTECNPVSLAAFGIDTLPFASCRNALLYNDATKRIVNVYKDQGEQRLAKEMAHLMAPLVSPEILASIDVITYIPATRTAFDRRGFDHGFLLATHVGEEVGRPVASVLARPRTSDQRALGNRGRIANMQEAFQTTPHAPVAGKTLLLIDDVMTTGATLIDASRALRAAGARQVHVITFAHA